jgi:hypothetical protein
VFRELFVRELLLRRDRAPEFLCGRKRLERRWVLLPRRVHLGQQALRLEHHAQRERHHLRRNVIPYAPAVRPLRDNSDLARHKALVRVDLNNFDRLPAHKDVREALRGNALAAHPHRDSRSGLAARAAAPAGVTTKLPLADSVRVLASRKQNRASRSTRASPQLAAGH